MLVHWKHEVCCSFLQLGKSLVARATDAGLGCACMMHMIELRSLSRNDPFSFPTVQLAHSIVGSFDAPSILQT